MSTAFDLGYYLMSSLDMFLRKAKLLTANGVPVRPKIRSFESV